MQAAHRVAPRFSCGYPVLQSAPLLAALLGGCASNAAQPAATSAPLEHPSIVGAPRIEPLTSSPIAPDTLFNSGGALEIVPGAESCRQKASVFVDIVVSVTEARPGLILRRDGGSSVLSFDNEDLAQHGWVGVSAAADCKQLAAVADFRVESPGWDLQFVLSQDHGQTLRRVGTLKKPYYMAQVSTFAMDEHGKGQLSMTLDDDYGAPVKPGIYHYETNDYGASWAPPRIEPLTSAPAPTRASPVSVASKADWERFAAGLREGQGR